MSIEEFGRAAQSMEVHHVDRLNPSQWADLRFKEVRKDDFSHCAIFTKDDSPDLFFAWRWDVESMLRSGARDGQSLPHFQLAQHALNRAHLAQAIKSGVRNVGLRCGQAVGFAVAFTTVMLGLSLVGNRLLSLAYDDNDDRDLAAAKPLAVQSDVSYNAATRTAYKKDAENLLLKWVFNNESQMEKACVVTIRKPDAILGAWGRQKYTETCYTEDAIPSVLKPTFNLPQP